MGRISVRELHSIALMLTMINNLWVSMFQGNYTLQVWLELLGSQHKHSLLQRRKRTKRPLPFTDTEVRGQGAWVAANTETPVVP